MAKGNNASNQLAARDLLSSAGALVSSAFGVDPAAALGTFLLEPTAAILNTLMALWLKQLADAALGHDLDHTLLFVVALTCSFGLARLASAFGIRLRIGLQERLGFALEERLARLFAAMPGLTPFEDPAALDRLDLVRREREYYLWSLNAATQGLREVARLIGTLALLVATDPRLLALLILGIPPLLGSIVARQRSEAAAEAAAEEERLADHLLDVATSEGAGREIRIFGLYDEVARRWSEATLRADEPVLSAETRAAFVLSLSWLGFAFGFAGAVVLVTLRAVNGNATAGDVLLVATLAGGVAGNVRSVATWTAEFIGALRFLARYVALIRLAPVATARTQPVPLHLNDGVTFADVSFQYPGTDRWVLREVNLRIPAGTAMALVGENGAGKTSFVKLICSFYEPTQGQILVDGTDLRRFDPSAWRLRLSAGFQDFVRFELRAGEAVGVGDLPRLGDAAAILQGLERAGAQSMVEQLEQGLATQLGKQWGGTDLSGGQWQKLALARASMQDFPLILILDEPTASLDAETEHALFAHYRTVARDWSARGGITVLVSHRFSTVRMADLIVVLADGQVREVGSHDDLLAKGGLYADLYQLQAKAYPASAPGG